MDQIGEFESLTTMSHTEALALIRAETGESGLHVAARMGEDLDPARIERLILAIRIVANALRGARSLDRELAASLHLLGFEVLRQAESWERQSKKLPKPVFDALIDLESAVEDVFEDISAPRPSGGSELLSAWRRSHTLTQRLKRLQFWGRDTEDDHLLLQVLNGTKTATADLAQNWHVPIGDYDDGDYDDGGYVAGDIVEVYDRRERLRCHLRITEVYETTFGAIPEKLWRGEACTSAEDFQRGHRTCWSDETLTDDTRIIGCHFELVKVEQ